MRILYLFRSLAVVGGAEKILVDKMNYFASLPGYEIFLITYEQGNHPLAFPLSPTVKHIDLGIVFYTRYQYGIIKRSLIYLKLKRRFQKVFAHQIQLIKPDIVCCTTYSLLEVETIMKLKDASKKIIESHSAKEVIGKQSIHKGNFFMCFASLLIDKKFYKNIARCDALVTLTQADADAWNAIRKATVIPNMLNYFPEQTKNIEQFSKQVISVGRLMAEKGYDLLIEAWQRVANQHPEWTLHIYGEGEYKNLLLQKILEYHLNQNIFIHPVTKRIYEKYLNSDFYVMSSRSEGFGLVLMEAMSCGIPCISFNCPHGPSDVITNNEDGLLVENGNIQQMAEKICYLIENPSIRESMGKKARENIKRYLPNKIMIQWINLFESLVNTRS